MTVLEMIAEWRKGCSCSDQEYIVPPGDTLISAKPLIRSAHPEACHECTRALIDAIERRMTLA